MSLQTPLDDCFLMAMVLKLSGYFISKLMLYFGHITEYIWVLYLCKNILNMEIELICHEAKEG